MFFCLKHKWARQTGEPQQCHNAPRLRLPGKLFPSDFLGLKICAFFWVFSKNLRRPKNLKLLEPHIWLQLRQVWYSNWSIFFGFKNCNHPFVGIPAIKFWDAATSQNEWRSHWKNVTLPDTNSLHLKMDGWKTTFLLGWPFSGTMSSTNSLKQWITCEFSGVLWHHSSLVLPTMRRKIYHLIELYWGDLHEKNGLTNKKMKKITRKTSIIYYPI